jgi:hypothetical protein
MPIAALGFFVLIHFSPSSKWEAVPVIVPFALAASMSMGLLLARFGQFRPISLLKQ